MSNNSTLDEAKRKLDELERRIQAARAQQGVVPEAEKDWQDMVLSLIHISEPTRPY